MRKETKAVMKETIDADEFKEIEVRWFKDGEKPNALGLASVPSYTEQCSEYVSRMSWLLFAVFVLGFICALAWITLLGIFMMAVSATGMYFLECDSSDDFVIHDAPKA